MSLFVAQTLNKQNEHVPLNMPLMFCKIIRIIVFFGRFSKLLTIDNRIFHMFSQFFI